MSNLAGDLLVGSSELSAELLSSEICPNLTSKFGPPRKEFETSGMGIWTDVTA